MPLPCDEAGRATAWTGRLSSDRVRRGQRHGILGGSPSTEAEMANEQGLDAIAFEIQESTNAIADFEAQAASQRLGAGEQDPWSEESVRLRLLTRVRGKVERLVVGDTMSLLSTTRFVFESVVWLKTVDASTSGRLRFQQEALKTSRQWWTKQVDHLGRERQMLERWELEEKTLLQHLMQAANAIEDKEEQRAAIEEMPRKIREEVDEQAAREFSLYGHAALTNGFSFQGHLVETQAKPVVSKHLQDAQADLNKFQLAFGSQVPDLKTKWNWRAAADAVGMIDEYDFVYSYTSILLHATAFNLVSARELEPAERMVFLNYIRVVLKDLIPESD